MMAGLKPLQGGNTVGTPDPINGSVVGTRAAQMLLNRLHSGRRHRLNISQRRSTLSYSSDTEVRL